MTYHTTRRRFLLVGSATAVAAALGVGATAGTGATSTPEWEAVKTPTENTLYDVNLTTDDAYAVGGGGVVIRRTSDGWTTVLDGGPTGNGNGLSGSDTTDDKERLWFVGASGAIGEYDVETDDLYDHSAPNDVINNFNDVAVTGEAGEATVYVAGDSGKIYYSFENGESGTWDSVTPGSGANINAIDFFDDTAGHAVDGDKTVFVTDDGTTWDKLGIADADHNFYGVDSDAVDDVTVSGGGGTIWNWNGSEWRREDTGDASLRDVEVADTPGLAVGGGGAVFRRDSDGWTQDQTPVGDNLKAVLRGADFDYPRDVAVGAGGTVIETT